MPLKGQCNCGAIQVSVDDDAAEKSQPIFCHCSNCRRQSGALGTYVSMYPDADVTITGSPKDYEDRSTDSGTLLHRWFCGACGCPIMSTSERLPGMKIIKMGLFDKIHKPNAEIYCKNKNEWEPVVEGTARLQGAF
ncbi:uncharacterized protein A1O5_05247 [Cladophialophora psammophila CBS 110553]|uniref:CENP-V/GFA domain-containing protein n=1 Tax=Cladophialophora psammophila CBS 110553 TaxID=1182543 RepID=W9XM73_9EURO|nr:uncharacterized protein A1O5_05247 [Cladophialophora psammophila CBS 110553]EXJ71439.1 hypothetical protein A1O5_05247 [Cladophialophora psammophila CBS 110553]